MALNLPNLQIRPDVVSSGAPPSGAQLLMSMIEQGLNTGLRKTEERGRNSRSSLEHEDQMAQLKLAQDKEKTRQAELKHQQTVMAGAAKIAQPIMETLLGQGRIDEVLSLANQASGGQLNLPPQANRPPSAVGGGELPRPQGGPQQGMGPAGQPLSPQGIAFMQAWNGVGSESKAAFMTTILPELTRLEDVARGRATAARLLETTGVMGTGANAGKPVTIYAHPTTGQTIREIPAVPKRDEASEAARKAANFLVQAVNADMDLQRVGAVEGGLGLSGDALRGQTGAGILDAITRYAVQEGTSPAQKQLAQANVAFTQAARFFMSGQQSALGERGDFILQYVSFKNDDPETRAQKAASRAVLMAGMERVAEGVSSRKEVLQQLLANPMLTKQQKDWIRKNAVSDEQYEKNANTPPGVRRPPP